MVAEFGSSFSAAMEAAGITPTQVIIPSPDDKIHRFKAGEDREANSWYVLHRRGTFIMGAFGCWKRNINQTWTSKDRQAMTPDERNEYAKVIKETKEAQANEEKANFEKVRRACVDLFSTAPRPASHPYLSKKGIAASASTVLCENELYPGWLAVPLQNAAGVVTSAQFIAEDGQKRFWYQGQVKDCFHVFAEVNHNSPIIICEGYATGASLYQGTGWTTVCALSAKNLEPVADHFHKKWPERKLIIAADDDRWTDGNPGLTCARKVAGKIKGLLAIPEFPESLLESKPTDFNDLHQLIGLPEVTRQVHKSVPSLKMMADTRFDRTKRPPDNLSIYRLAGITICTPGNLTTITSAVKVGKSAVIGAMIGVTFPHPELCDFLGFTSGNPQEKAVIHIDSEQSPADHWHSVDRILRRAKADREPGWFYSHCLTGKRHDVIFEGLKTILAAAVQLHNGIHSIFIDGFADLVSDVNDAGPCNNLVADLMSLAQQYYCPIIGVIHLNPTTNTRNAEKSRGHLGSQLERKAETNLGLERKDGPVVTIYSEKSRGAPIPKGKVAFDWNPNEHMHMSVDPSPYTPKEKGGRPGIVTQVSTMNLHAFIAGCSPNGEGKNAIARRLEAFCASVRIGIKPTAAKDTIEALVTNGKLTKNANCLFIKGPNA